MKPSDEFYQEKEEQAALWCMRLAEGDLTVRVQQEFDSWVADSANAKVFEEVALTWTTAGLSSNMPEIIRLRAEALEEFRRANLRRWSSPVSKRIFGVVAVAACIVVAIAAAAFYMDSIPKIETYRTGIGERRLVAIADGSHVSLDADTEVSVQLRNDRRALNLLHGRAKFDVAKDPLRPFTVTAGDKIVVATGTSFSVEMIANTVHVLLYSGHVAVLNKGDSKPVQLLSQNESGGNGSGEADSLLHPGVELIAPMDQNGSGSLKSVDETASLSWEQGQLVFNSEQLSSVVERSNRYSSEKIAIDPSLKRIEVSGIFTAGDTEFLAEGIAALHKEIRIKHQDGEIVLRRS